MTHFQQPALPPQQPQQPGPQAWQEQSTAWQQEQPVPAWQQQPNGAPAQHDGGPVPVRKTGESQQLSLASMILGLGSLLFLGWLMFPQVIGIVVGHMGLAKESPQGRSFAVTGLVTSYLALAIWGALWAFGLFFLAALMGSLESDFTTYT